MKRKILLIDDDEDEYEIFREALSQSRLSVECITINCSKAALKLLETVSPDFIFVDYNMPAVNGVECLKQIRKMDRMENVPIILFSTAIDNSVEQKARAFGAIACIRKTDSVSKLSDTLEKLLLVD